MQLPGAIKIKYQFHSSLIQLNYYLIPTKFIIKRNNCNNIFKRNNNNLFNFFDMLARFFFWFFIFADFFSSELTLILFCELNKQLRSQSFGSKMV